MKNKIKILIIFAGCMLFRLIPLRAPNIEPVMASIMPIGRKYGAMFGFIFGFLSIFIYDWLTHFGSWTWIAGITYGLIGVTATFYFKKFKATPFNFATFAVCATILYDLITGVLFAPIFHESMFTALILQIPFTALHLAGNIAFAFMFSPVLNRWLAVSQIFVFKKRVSISKVSVVR